MNGQPKPVDLTPGKLRSGLSTAARSHRDDLIGAADVLTQHPDLVVESEPEAHLVGMNVDTAYGSQRIVDVVVTTATVSLDRRTGWGCVMGWDPEAALAAAILDAANEPASHLLAGRALVADHEVRATRQRAALDTQMGLA